MRQPILQTPFQGIGAGKRAVLQIPTGYRYHNIRLRYVSTQALGTAQVVNSTVMTNELSEISLVVGKKAQRIYTGEQLIMLNQFVGKTINNNFLDIPFSEDDRNTINGEEALAWGTANLPNPAIELRVNIAGSTYPTVLEAYTEQDDLPLQLGAIVKTYQTSFNVSAAGPFTWNPDYSRGGKIRRVHVKDSNHITAVEVKANGRVEYDATVAYNTERLKQAGYVPQTNWFHVVHDINHGVYDNMDTVRLGADQKGHLLNSLAYKFTFDAAGNYTVIWEEIGVAD